VEYLGTSMVIAIAVLQKALAQALLFFAELIGAMQAIEIANSKGWSKLWHETHSKLVQLTFKVSSVVPWQLRNMWSNCLGGICLQFSFVGSMVVTN
jgi:hypothetical protein